LTSQETRFETRRETSEKRRTLLKLEGLPLNLNMYEAFETLSNKHYQYGNFSSSSISSLSLGSIRTIWLPRLKNTKPESESSSQILLIACSEHLKFLARSGIVHSLSFTSSLSSGSSPSNYLRQPRIPEFDDSEVSHHTIVHNSSANH